MIHAVLMSLVVAHAAPANSVVQKVDLQKDLKSSGFVNLYETESVKKAGKLSPLAQLKSFEIQLKWNQCAELAPRVFTSQKEVRGWVALTWLHCLSQVKPKSSAAETKALAAIAKNKELFHEGPWAQELWQTWVSRELDRLEVEVKNKNKSAEHGIEQILDPVADLTKDQKSEAYQLLGDLALARNDYKEAQFLYEEAQAQKDSKYISDKLEFLAKTQGQALVAKSSAPSVEATGEDGKLEERIRQSLKQGDLIPALKDCVALLNQYPGSRAARRLKDKPLEIYNSISDANVETKALHEMRVADSSRLLDWAQSLHRRLDYEGSLALAQTAYEKNPQSPTVTSSLWVAGRSAHFLGKYDEALDFYNKLITFNSGSDEAAEALFRSSLIYYRKKDYTSASALLERLLLQSRDRYDLNGQYWLVRSLEQTNKERAQKAAQVLIDKYPFSYYGMRLKAEANGGKLTWPEQKGKAPVLASEIFLVGAQKKTWTRFNILSEAGWTSEAHIEVQEGPYIKDPTLKVRFAQKLSERHQYFTAIRMLNDALEADPSLRREEYLRIGYPSVFASLYAKESTRYGIDPVLLRSLTRQESGFNMRAVSTSNALGLMQMIPPTAQEVAKKLGLQVSLPDDMFRPEVNIPMGSFYVSQMLDQFQGNVPFALAGYNAGPHRMKSWLDGRDEVKALVNQPSSAPIDELWFDELPWNETSFYVKAILRNVLIYRMLDKESFVVSPVLWQDLLSKKAK
ncbi:lytic transglycosylase domain-containing protein [Bdellovibrio svalbardensis]|uniref:Transglycosylase SLT domain-containing protein n=1 Tax=Bdellovibrio svalbardensis TaxID=2972972 RepID=A0ABT6DLY2_9BACT|nr:transglycosylase SLT domain-containing protein [Bdellovibrio svalbardensis]MDG0817886.1 transglycosylase SLT domain-containing protein [Bdellovibrio svalbardensis]